MSKINKIIFLALIVLFPAKELSSDFSTDKYWVFFKDKDAALLKRALTDISYRRTLVSERSIKRRMKLLEDTVIQESDIPVSEEYLKRLSDIGLKPVVVSKWLNAGSFYLSVSELNMVKELPFVLSVRKVARYAVPMPVQDGLGQRSPGKSAALDYGSSFGQNNLTGTLELHLAGITGKGILIGMLDTGFNRNHESLANIEIVAEYDFIHSDTTTSDQPGQDVSGQDSHGTATLSAVGGFSEGSLIGTAYGAQFALAKTEEISSETSIEEDFWVAGIEWLDSVGVDVISSSLGYTTFSDVSYYTTADMDGNTAVTTIAADLAADKGIVVVSSAGNEGGSAWRIVSAPADGDNVLAVGAVWPNRTIAGFSSRGPTADGRIKPDVMGQGVAVISAISGNYSGYFALNGTSLSCPLVAGSAALILSAHPGLNSRQVVEALKETADNSELPNNDFGWGIVDALSAVTYFGPAFSNVPVVENTGAGSRLSTHVVSTTGVDRSSVMVQYSVGTGAPFTPLPMEFAGENSKFTGVIPVTSSGTIIEFYFTAKDLNGKVTIYPDEDKEILFTLVSGETDVKRVENVRREIPSEYTISQNYPNPFNQVTTVEVGIKESAQVSLQIVDVLGRTVHSVYNGTLASGTYFFKWDGSDDSGISASSGIYFFRISAPGFTASRKIVYVK